MPEPTDQKMYDLVKKNVYKEKYYNPTCHKSVTKFSQN